MIEYSVEASSTLVTKSTALAALPTIAELKGLEPIRNTSPWNGCNVAAGGRPVCPHGYAIACPSAHGQR